MKKLASLALILTGFLFAGTAAHAGPQPNCESLGDHFIKIERLTPTPDFPTTGSTMVRSVGVAPGYCRHTNLVHKPGTDLRLTISNQLPLTQTVVKSSATGVIGSCVKWNDVTNSWSFEPLSGVAPTLCGVPKPVEAWCDVTNVGSPNKCSVTFLYVQNYYTGTYEASYHYTDYKKPSYIPMNIPKCSAAAPSVAPATQQIYGNHLGCFRKISGFNRTAAGDVFTQQLLQHGLGGNSPLKEVFGW
jgi:hypothetical protein